MFLSTTYKTLWLGGVWWLWEISWWCPKERSETWQENGLWKEENMGKYLKEPLGWIFGIIKRELNLYVSDGDTLEDLQDRHETTLAYWRQNHQQYPPEWLWDTFYYDLLRKSFESRYELRAWCLARLKQLKDPMYLEEQRLKVEEVKRLAWEAERQRRRETPGTWEHYFAK
jgi:hypothetical protein